MGPLNAWPNGDAAEDDDQDAAEAPGAAAGLGLLTLLLLLLLTMLLLLAANADPRCTGHTVPSSQSKDMISTLSGLRSRCATLAVWHSHTA